MENMFEFICKIFGHSFKMMPDKDQKVNGEDALFFVYRCRVCGKLKFVSKNKFKPF